MKARTLIMLTCIFITACSNDDTPVPVSDNSGLSSISRTTRFDAAIAQIGRQERIDPKLIHAVIRQESNYDPNARSSAGAVGLMQLMPGTAGDYGLSPHDRYDPVKNIRAGTRHLKRLMKMFPGKLHLVLAAYNAGQGNVIKYGYMIPPFQETQTYVRRVTGYYQAHQRLTRAYKPRTYLSDPSLALLVDTVEPNVDTQDEDRKNGY